MTQENELAALEESTDWYNETNCPTFDDTLIIAAAERWHTKMTQENELAALEESIAHWRGNCARHNAGQRYATGASVCACCQLQVSRQFRQFGDDDVDDFECFHATGNCPIAEYTGAPSCDGTPYYAVVDDTVPPETMLKWLQELHAYLVDGTVGPELWDQDIDCSAT
jgi:hypothetical protein